MTIYWVFSPIEKWNKQKHQKTSLDFTYLQLFCFISLLSVEFPGRVLSTHCLNFSSQNILVSPSLPSLHQGHQGPLTSCINISHNLTWSINVLDIEDHSRTLSSPGFQDTTLTWFFSLSDCSFSDWLADSSSSPQPLNVDGLKQFHGLTITDKLVIPNVCLSMTSLWSPDSFFLLPEISTFNVFKS